MTNPLLDPWLLDHIVCPVDQKTLSVQASVLSCGDHTFPIVEGIPILLHPERSVEVKIVSLDTNSLEALAATHRKLLSQLTDQTIDPFVNQAVLATNGIMFESIQGALTEYPHPEIRLPEGTGKRLLDIGCNWGRWSIAATRKGYSVVGMDPNPEAVLAAQRVATQLKLSISFIVGDARHLPFRSKSFDTVYSFSVLQHFSREDVCLCLGGIRKILNKDGTSLIQMANTFGLRSLYHQLRRGFKEGTVFDVRYWTPLQLRKAWERHLGPTEISIDGFFALNAQPSEAALLPSRFRMVIFVSEVLRKIARVIPILLYFADSLYLKASKSDAI